MSTSKLVPFNPEQVMVIRDISPNITTLSVPFLRFGLVKFGGRATIVKLATGSLFIFSPVALTPAVQAKITSLGGRVSYIAAPDLEHHIYLSSWARAYPSAHFIAPEGLAEKRAKLSVNTSTKSASDSDVTNIPFQTIFTAANKHEIKITPELDAEMDYEYVDSHLNKELVFFHRPSRTLIQADLFFNLPATEQFSLTGTSARSGWASRLACVLQNTAGSAFWQKSVLWYLVSSGDRKGFNQSMRRINAWGFENVIPCHGDSMVGDGKGIFERVMQWHLKANK